MRKKRAIPIEQHQLLTKRLEKIVALVLSNNISMQEARKRIAALSATYDIHAEYLDGYVWGQLVALAQTNENGTTRH
jgi:hypothetical protein